jgi:hypothetical protein
MTRVRTCARKPALSSAYRAGDCPKLVRSQSICVGLHWPSIAATGAALDVIWRHEPETIAVLADEHFASHLASYAADPAFMTFTVHWLARCRHGRCWRHCPRWRRLLCRLLSPVATAASPAASIVCGPSGLATRVPVRCGASRRHV